MKTIRTQTFLSFLFIGAFFLNLSARTADTVSVQRAGWGVSTAVGYVSQYRNSLMLTALYGWAFAPGMEVEMSISFLEYARETEQILYLTNISTTIPTITRIVSFSRSLSGDISCVIAPFPSDDWQRFQLRTGLSLRRAGRISSSSGISLDTTRLYSRAVYTQQLAFGGHLGIEYYLSLQHGMDIGFRADIHAYLPPFWVEGENVLLEYYHVPTTERYGIFPAGGSFSLGIFLRFSF